MTSTVELREPNAKLPFRSGKPYAREALSVSKAVCRRLDTTLPDGLQNDYERLAELGIDGRLYPALTAAAVRLDDLVAAVNEGSPGEMWFDPDVWTPEVKAGVDTRAPEVGRGRLALHNGEGDTRYTTSVLHALGLPYRVPTSTSTQTQQEWLRDAKYNLEANHPKFTAGALGLRAVLIMMLMAKERGHNWLNALDERGVLLSNGGVMRITDAPLVESVEGGVQMIPHVVELPVLKISGAAGEAAPNFGVGIEVQPRRVA